MSGFGSAARGVLGEDSNINVLVQFSDNATVDTFDFVHLESEVSSLLGRAVDLVSRRGMNPRIAPHILSEARLLYAA